MFNLKAVFSHVVLANKDACIVDQDVQVLVALLVLCDKLLNGPGAYHVTHMALLTNKLMKVQKLA